MIIQNTPETLIKLFFKCKEFFILRTKVINLLKAISDREGFMQAFQIVVRELNTSADESKQHNELFKMTSELK